MTELPSEGSVVAARRLLATGGVVGGSYPCPAKAADEALTLLLPLLKADLEHMEARALAIRAYRWLGRPEDAKRLLRSAGPKRTPELVAEAGWLAYDFENYGDAIRNFDEALEQDPSHSDTIAGLGASLRATEGPDAAEKFLNELTPTKPNDSVLLTERGWVHFAKEQYRPALEKFRDALKGNPHYLDALVGAVECLRAEGDYQGALRVLDDAGRQFPSSPVIVLQHGWVAFDRGRYEDALTLFLQARALAPSLSQAVEGHVASLRYLGRTRDAQQVLDGLPAQLAGRRDILVQAGLTAFEGGAYVAAELAFEKAHKKRIRQRPGERESWRAVWRNAQWRSLHLPSVRRVRKEIEERAAELARKEEPQLLVAIDALDSECLVDADEAERVRRRVRGQVRNGLWREGLGNALVKVLDKRLASALFVSMVVVALVVAGAAYLWAQPDVGWALAGAVAVYPFVFVVAAGILLTLVDLSLSNRRKFVVSAWATLIMLAATGAVFLRGPVPVADRLLPLAAATGVAAALLWFWAFFYGSVAALALVDEIRPRRVVRAHPEEVVVLELVRLTSEMEYAPAWYDLEVRRMWGDRIERVARALERRLLKSAARRDVYSPWSGPRLRAVGAGLRELRTRTLAPDATAQDDVQCALRGMLVNVATGRLSMLPSGNPPTLHEQLSWVRLRRLLQLVVSAGLPAAVLWTYQTYVAGPDTQLPGFVGVVVYVAWPALSLLAHIDPQLFDKLAALRGSADVLGRGSTR